MNKYEKLIDLIISEDEEKAKGLFHEIVVEKSKTIYESLMDDEIAEEITDDKVGDLAQDVEADEEGVNEEDDEMEMELDAEAGDDGEMGIDDMDIDDGAEEGGDEAPATKGDVMDLESAIDELKAEFDKIMDTVDADGDGDHDMEDHEDAGEEAEADDEETEESVQFESADEKAEDDDEEVAEAEEVDEAEEVIEEEVEEVVEEDDGQEDLDRLREYVEKVAGVPNTGGADNNSSVVAGKNDMGGEAGNIAQGGDEKGGKVASPKVDSDGNVNVPGGKASKLAPAPKPKSAE